MFLNAYNILRNNELVSGGGIPCSAQANPTTLYYVCTQFIVYWYLSKVRNKHNFSYQFGGLVRLIYQCIQKLDSQWKKILFLREHAHNRFTDTVCKVYGKFGNHTVFDLRVQTDLQVLWFLTRKNEFRHVFVSTIWCTQIKEEHDICYRRLIAHYSVLIQNPIEIQKKIN